MDSSDLLDQTFFLLANDTTFLSYGGYTPQSPMWVDGVNGAPPTGRAAYIQKEEETDGVVTGQSIPMALLYIRPGHPDYRSSVNYIGKVVIDCFAKDGNTARMMSARVKALMQNWSPPGGYVSRFAYDTSFKTGIAGVKGHRIFFDVSYFVG